MEILDDLVEILVILLFFGLPAVSFLLFVISLVRFLTCPKDDPERPKRKKKLIISIIPAAIICGAFIALMILIGLAVAHM